ncbi:protein SGT1 homolog B-like isoform X2 [Rhodamnia argentea]|uniref:Protein SGT1 homolog n=1 Tax=Rhodamnia argentea TaxID=178133 RepID=A0A8B8P626_9MYRT|nr:protein SGT1 homolog B-like isoform X2 [Rhodamnia argentea]
MAATSDLADRAGAAFLDDDFESAVDFYSKAVDPGPGSADLYADRAQAHIKLRNFTEAISDANKAIELDPSLAKAYLRKGSACMNLEEYHTAKAALEMGASLSQDALRFTNLIEECEKRIAEDVTDQKAHICALPSSATALPSDQNADADEEIQKGHGMVQQINAIEPVKPKFRHEFYQQPDEVVVTIFAKGVAPEDVLVEFGGQILSVRINVSSDAYNFQTRLFGKVIPEKCRYQILSTKIEIRLAKAEAIQWRSLEYSKEATVPQKVNVPSVGPNRPAYPSSKNRAVDWDKLEAQVKLEEKDEKLDGDAALNKLFRDIFLNADEDARRAMTKSFVESNGTVLSTNWKEVAEKKVEGSPPDGMELRKWEY